MRGSTIPARAAWTVWTGAAAASVVLLCLGLSQKLYVGSVTNAFERDQIGNTLILAGALLRLAAAGWSLYRSDAVWVTAMVTAPAVIIGGLNLVAGDSLLPHLAALAAVPLGLDGIIGGFAVRWRRMRS